MASIQWTPPAGWVEETGAHVLMLAPCDCTATSTLLIGANAYTIVDGMGASFSTRGGVFATGALLEFVLDVDAKKAYLLSQAGLSTAPQKPKLLWKGSATQGSWISVPGLFDYAVILVAISLYGWNCPMIGLKGGDGFSFGAGISSVIENSARYNRVIGGHFIRNDSTSNQVLFQDCFSVTIGTNSVYSADGGDARWPIVEIVGLVKDEDLQGVTT